MLMGSYQNSIDAKNRLIIPAKFRDELGFRCVLTRGLDSCLVIYPEKTWEAQQSKLASLPMSDKKARAFKRFIYENATELEIDKQGRVLLPQQFKEVAHIEKELVTIGMLDRVEIWAKEIYENDELGGQLSPEDFSDFSDSYQI